MRPEVRASSLHELWARTQFVLFGKAHLYRAVDKQGQTIDFLLTKQRDEEAALRFLKKAIGRHEVPDKITIDGSAANEAAIKHYNKEHGTAIIIRQVKYLNNVVEQDHRGVKIPAASSGAFRAGGHYADIARSASTCP